MHRDDRFNRPGRRRGAELLITAALVAAALAVTGCGRSSPASPAGRRVAVVAGENFWGDITAQIGGAHVSVTSIITDPNADPHTYETDPRDASAINNAALVIENGAGYDDFIDKLLSATPRSNRDVLSIAHSIGISGGNPNPHLWYNPDDVTAAARTIESHLATRDPADASTFESNLRHLLDGYQPYIDTVASIRAKYAGTPIAYTERVPGYLVLRAGLRLATPASFAQSIEDGNDPSPADTAAMDSAMTQKQVRLLLYNSQATSGATQKVRNLATSERIPVVGVSETMPSGTRSFQAWQIAQARAILAALGG